MKTLIVLFAVVILSSCVSNQPDTSTIMTSTTTTHQEGTGLPLKQNYGHVGGM